MPELADISTTIKGARRRLGISQENAAREVGVTRMTWWRWEKGDDAPGDDSRPKVAAFLGVKESALRRDPDVTRIDPLTLLIRETVEREVERALRRHARAGALAL